MSDETYTCARCRGVFGKGQTDEDALAERDALWGAEVKAGHAFDVICDDCFQKFQAWRAAPPGAKSV